MKRVVGDIYHRLHSTRGLIAMVALVALLVVGVYGIVSFRSSTTEAAASHLLNATQVSAGDDHNCAVADGKAYCWGEGDDGQLGNGSTSDRSTPVAVDTSGALDGKVVTAVSAGYLHTCAIADGEAFCWGDGSDGQLGTGNRNSHPTPVAVNASGALDGRTVTDISAGYLHTCAIADGEAYCWGDNNLGQLGDDTDTSRNTPIAVNTSGALDGKTVTGISTGDQHTCAIADDEAYCWGAGALGRDDSSYEESPVAVNTSGVLSGKAVEVIEVGGFHTCAIADGEVYCWGENDQGRLGDGSTSNRSTPVAVDTSGVLSGKTASSLGIGYHHSCAIADDEVYCWGRGALGRLGNGAESNSSTPVAVEMGGSIDGRDVLSMSSGGGHSCVVTADHRVYCWGNGSNGQIGDGENTNVQSTPALVSRGEAPSRETDLSMVGYRWYENADNTAPGDPLSSTNNAAELMESDQDFRLRVGLKGVSAVDSVALGGAHTCALSGDHAYCWGVGSRGRLGNGGTDNQSISVAVDADGTIGGRPVTTIEGGSQHTCAVADGRAFCWGSGLYGLLGNGSDDNQSVPVAVDVSGALNGREVTDISGGELHTCAVADGRAFCWGSGFNGRLGDGSGANRSTPAAVSTSGVLNGRTVAQVSAGAFHTCAMADNRAYCWGNGSDGQLGNGSTSNQTAPVAVDSSGVLNGRAVTQVSAGYSHTCAVAGGRAYCWGVGTDGRLGNGSTSNQSSPVAVDTSGVLGGRTVTQINAGYAHTCAVADGEVFCWGNGVSGQLGSGATSSAQLTPIAVNTSGVLSGKTATEVSTGNSHTCATADGEVHCWGSGVSGRLGNGSMSGSHTSPVLANHDLLRSAPIPAETNKLRVQYAERTASTCSAQSSGFSEVTTSTPIAFHENGSVQNNATITAHPSDPFSSSDISLQTYRSAPGVFSNKTRVSSTEVGLFDISLTDNDAPAETTYCVRLAYHDGEPLEEVEEFPEIRTSRKGISVDIVEGDGSIVPSPSFDMESAYMQTQCQQVTGIFGTTQQRLRITNSEPEGWSVTMAATDGPTASWQRSGGGTGYDFNDPSGSPSGCNSGSDGDGLAGQLRIDPSAATIAAQSSCSTTGVSLGSASAFEEGTNDAIELLRASPSAQHNCYWDITGIEMSQQIPSGQDHGDYMLDVTVTAVSQ